VHLAALRAEVPLRADVLAVRARGLRDARRLQRRAPRRVAHLPLPTVLRGRLRPRATARALAPRRSAVSTPPSRLPARRAPDAGGSGAPTLRLHRRNTAAQRRAPP